MIGIILALIQFGLLGVIILIILKIKSPDTSVCANVVDADIEDKIERALVKSWMGCGIEQKIGTIDGNTREIRDMHKSIEQMMRVPTERGAIGEISLEVILADQLPPDMFGIRKRITGGKIPDAHIRTSGGIICIDSKFPLDNYIKMVEHEGDGANQYRKLFIRDIKDHLDTVSDSYVCPENGTAEFAFVYIPSEAVYYYLAKNEFDLLREYTKRGVQIISPLTLSHKIEIIKAGIHAQKLSEDTTEIKRNINLLSREFDRIDDLWRIFYGTHMKNFGAKASEIDAAYQKIRKDFDDISKMNL